MNELSGAELFFKCENFRNLKKQIASSPIVWTLTIKE